MTLNLVECRLWKGGIYTKPVPLGQAQPVPVGQADWDRLCLSHWDRLCLSQWDRHTACTRPVTMGLGKVKRDLSLSHGQVIYPRWRPVLVAGQALCPRWNLSQSNLSQPVPQSGTTMPWKSRIEILIDNQEQITLSGGDQPPPPNVNYSRSWYAFSMLKLTKFPSPYGGGLTFYYTSHDMNRFDPHVHRARPPVNGFESGLNLAENRIEYVLLTTWDTNSIFFSANRARPGSQKLPLNGFAEWNFLRNKEKAYQNRE